MNNKDSKKRIQFTFGVFLLCFSAIAIKAFIVQVVDRDYLLSKSKKQFFRERSVYPRRGNILDRDGNPLAINIRTYSIFAIPKNFKTNQELNKLKKILPKHNLTKANNSIRKRNRFTWIARKIRLTKDQLQKVKDLPGIYAEEVPKRIYPNKDLAAQTLGFVGIDNTGLSGIEYLFDKKLRGEPQIIKYITDRKGRPVRYVSQNTGEESSEDIYLSYDKELQAVAEKAIKEAVDEVEAFRGGIGVMDVDTGEILAMANYPTYDPNDLSNSENIHRKLSFVTDPFEPGSTFKTLTVASALENNIVRPETNYYCEHGRLKVEDHIISEAESHKNLEWLSVSEIIKYSSNVGTTKIGFDLTFPRLKDTLDKFKIGKKTGIEIPGESRGIFTNDKNVSPLSLSNISFGQGVAATGIQMLAAYAAIANGGEYVKPTILRVEDKTTIEKKRILPLRTAKELTKMLISVVEDGTGGSAKIANFTIAGKTSTAQRSDKNGVYKGYVGGFIGFPVGVKRRFVVYSYVDNPMSGKPYYGNIIAGPAFKKVTQFLLYKNKEFEGLANQKNYRNNVAFDTVALKQSSKRNLGRGVVPNFVGLDKKSASKMALKYDLDLRHSGIGVVLKQSPDAGTKLEKNQYVKLNYAPPTYE